MNEHERQKARSTNERKQRSEVALGSIYWTPEGKEEEEIWRQFHLSQILTFKAKHPV